MKYRRARKEQNRDRRQHYGGLAETTPDGDAAKRFIRQAYGCFNRVIDKKEKINHEI